MNGIKLAKILYKINGDVKIEFVTENKDYALDAFEIHAFDYLLIPHSKDTVYLSKKKSSEIEKRLPTNEFSKFHRSYIINLEKVAQIEPWFNRTYILKLNDINK
ncbi:MAG TPA: LytTR family transcriptional regulator DNA-binding domain-containing protein [Clostridium sp.]